MALQFCVFERKLSWSAHDILAWTSAQIPTDQAGVDNPPFGESDWMSSEDEDDLDGVDSDVDMAEELTDARFGIFPFGRVHNVYTPLAAGLKR